MEKSGDTARRGAVLKFIVVLIGLLSVGVSGLFVILKIDGYSDVDDWSWWMVLGEGGGAPIALVLLWMAFDYYSLGDMRRKDTVAEVDRELLRRVVPSDVESFHEAQFFRDIWLMLGYGLMIFYSVMTSIATCSDCQTPYKIYAIIMASCYGIRLLFLMFFTWRDFDHLRRLAVELRFDHNRFYDEPNSAIIRDLWLSSPWTFANALNMFLWWIVCLMSAVATVWVQQSLCSSICEYQWTSCGNLLYGIYGVEGFYAVTAVMLKYARRKSGVEAVQHLIQRVAVERFPGLGSPEAISEAILARSETEAERADRKRVCPKRLCRTTTLCPSISAWYVWTRNADKLKDIFAYSETTQPLLVKR